MKIETKQRRNGMWTLLVDGQEINKQFGTEHAAQRYYVRLIGRPKVKGVSVPVLPVNIKTSVQAPE